MPFGLYLHYPFCRNLCAYCDFYKVPHEAALEREYFEALSVETELVAEEYAELDNEVATVYVGGGTPSLMNLDLFATWLDQVRSVFYMGEVEFSFECNPESVTRELLSRLRELGVNRPVFGVQSFRRDLLRRLTRVHNPGDSHRAVYLANALGFDNFGVDLIFGLPGQSSEALSRDLDQIIELEPKHVSFYQLTVEAGTPLHRQVSEGTVRLPDADFSHGLYRGGAERLAEAGYVRYEVSSFARPGYECRHNIGYWEGADYLGLGPSAHSFMHGRRFANTADVREYARTLLSGRRPLVVDESGFESRMTEAIMLGLRTAQGIDRAAFQRRFGVPVEERLVREEYHILVESGYLLPEKGRLRLSDEGLLLADEITRRLVVV